MKLTQLKSLCEALTTTGIGPRPDYADIEIRPTVFIRDGRLHVSAEAVNAWYWADYYGEFRGECAWINPKLEEFAKIHGGYWEWDNPGSISFST